MSERDEMPDKAYLYSGQKWNKYDNRIWHASPDSWDGDNTKYIKASKAKQDKLDLLKALIAIHRDKSYHLLTPVIDKLKQEIEGE